MKIKKGTKVIVNDSRKGRYTGIAIEDFDTESEWYPIATLEYVRGLTTDWEVGDEIPCRKGLAKLSVCEEEIE